MNFQSEFAEFIRAKDRMAEIVDSDDFQSELHDYADYYLNRHAYDAILGLPDDYAPTGFGTHPAALKFGHWTLEQEYSDAAFLTVQQCVGLDVEVIGIPVAWFFDRDSFRAAEHAKADASRHANTGQDNDDEFGS